MAISSAQTPSLVWTLNTVSGAVAQVSPHLLEHALFKHHLVEVAPHTKSYQPEMWKPTTADEYRASHPEAPLEDGHDVAPEHQDQE